MRNSQKSPRFSRIKNILSQMPKDGFKRSIVYGIPVLAAVLVVAVVAATFLTQADQAEAVFGRVELEEYE